MRCKDGISIHALLAESDLRELLHSYQDFRFLSTLSLRRATALLALLDHNLDDFYPRSPCGERPGILWVPRPLRLISIHALLAESDLYVVILSRIASYFYPRSPCGERHVLPHGGKHVFQFLSTLSLRRATQSHWYPSLFQNNFYPRSPCGERLCLACLLGIG